jgi:hypothetical protein
VFARCAVSSAVLNTVSTSEWRGIEAEVLSFGETFVASTFKTDGEDSKLLVAVDGAMEVDAAALGKEAFPLLVAAADTVASSGDRDGTLVSSTKDGLS